MSVKFDKDLTENWQTYFPPRGGVYPKFVSGRNFNAEVLHYISKPWIAEHIADRIDQVVQNGDYFAIDMCANVGGNTLEFLSRENCVTTMSFEIDKERSIMLQRNIKEYKLDKKAVVVNEEVNSAIDFNDYKDAVFFFDPPWLPKDLKNPGADYRKYYIREHMKLGDLTLEEWLVKLKDIAYAIIYRVPDNYKLNEVDGWTYLYENLGSGKIAKEEAKDGKLFICINNRNMKIGDKNKFGGSFIMGKIPSIISNMNPPDLTLTNQFKNFISTCSELSLSVAKDTPGCKMFVKYGFEDPDPEFVKPVESKPLSLKEQVVTIPGLPSPSKDVEKGSPEWVAEFQFYISKILGAVITKAGAPNSEIVNQLIDGDNIPIWIQAFTDQSQEPDTTKNYEVLEIIGDAVCDYTFKQHIFARFKRNISKDAVNDLTAKYMSYNFQSYASLALKLRDWVIIDSKIIVNEKVDEDLYESFFGALVETGDRVKTGLGMVLCQKMMNFLCKNCTFELSTSKNAKQVVGQRLSSAFGGLEQTHIEVNARIGADRIHIIEVFVKPITIKRLRSEGITIPDNGLIGIGRNTLKDEAKDEAFAKALEKLDQLGATATWASDLNARRSKTMLEKENPLLMKQFTDKLLLDGYTDGERPMHQFDVKIPHNSIVPIYTLYGIKNGEKVRLGSGKNKDSSVKAQLQAIEEYVNSI